MKQIYITGLFAVLFFPLSLVSQSTSTFSQVHQILQLHCAGSGCHDGGTYGLFNVNLSDSAFYATIINAPVNNPAADAKFNKVVVPGDVQRSFMLRKLAHGISNGLALIPA